MNAVKIKKIESQIAKEISDILMREVRDELFKTITITGAKVASDVGSAKVYFTSYSDIHQDRMEKELNEASGYIRTKLANSIELRHTPVLEFIYDKSIEYGENIENIIKKINQSENEQWLLTLINQKTILVEMSLTF